MKLFFCTSGELPYQIQPWASHNAATVFKAPSQKLFSYALINLCL